MQSFLLSQNQWLNFKKQRLEIFLYSHSSACEYQSRISLDYVVLMFDHKNCCFHCCFELHLKKKKSDSCVRLGQNFWQFINLSILLLRLLLLYLYSKVILFDYKNKAIHQIWKELKTLYNLQNQNSLPRFNSLCKNRQACGGLNEIGPSGPMYLYA